MSRKYPIKKANASKIGNATMINQNSIRNANEINEIALTVETAIE